MVTFITPVHYWNNFHRPSDTPATSAELRGATNGTRWTNEQLLFHMMFGYLLTRNLLPLVKAFGRLPRFWSRGFAAALDAASRPFHVINYVGPLGGARLLGHARMEDLLDRVIDSLIRSLNHASQAQLDRGMHFPVGRDPYFRDFMTLRQVYHYATQHYRHHRNQLTLSNAAPIAPPGPEAPVVDRPRRAERPKPRVEGLSPREAATVYDCIGRLQDTQRVFETPALAWLTADGRLADARSVVEIGCGTGRFARELLTDVCGAECRYIGLDVSPRMCRIASARLAPWPDRARVLLYDGSVPLPLHAASADRVVAAFLLDLLPTQYGRELLADAHRVLAPDGLLCLASLTYGTTPASRAFSTAWSSLARRAPELVGGCRPVVLAELLEPGRWAVHTDTTVTAWGFPAEVPVATRQE